MVLKFVRNTRLLAFTPLIDGIFDNKYDRVDDGKGEKFYETDESEEISGGQRLRNLFRKHGDDIVHPAITSLAQTALGSFIIGGIYGALGSSRDTFINFIEKNEATQFRNHLDAKRKLSDEMFRSYMKGFGKWGTKVCVFVSTFTATQLALSVYQNKYSFWHYSAGGATAGALYKFSLGPRGMIAGGVFGGAFGTIYGGFKVLMLKLTNQTEDDMLNFGQKLSEMKKEFDTKWEKKSQTKEIEEELKQILLDPKAQPKA